MRKILNKVIYNIIHERRCLVCASLFLCNDNLIVCENCKTKIEEYKGAHCPKCGEIHINPNGANNLCSECIKKLPVWTDFRFFAKHEAMIRAIILQAKHNHNLAAANFLGEVLVPKCKEFKDIDFLIPMPVHKKRLNFRGYNQCVEIAKPISKALNIPIRNDILFRTKHTIAQAYLPKHKRKTNLIGVFLANNLAQNKNILLIDDTMTTGTSLREASQALIKAGAKNIYVCVVSRTERDATAFTATDNNLLV